MGSIRTLQKGKKADARQRELGGILRHAKNEIVDMFAVRDFEIKGDWFQIDDHHELVFDDIRVGSGGVRVFRRNSCGRFYSVQFDGPEDPDGDREHYGKIDKLVSLFEKESSGYASDLAFALNTIFKDLDHFLYSSEKSIDEMTISCPDCGGTGETVLDGNICDCATCDGTGGMLRELLA